MSQVHLLGFPRIGAKRELKFLLEQYWRGDITEQAPQAGARELRQKHCLLQKGAGLDISPVGDFSLYDQVLDAQVLVGAIPRRFGFDAATLSNAQYFQLARGNAQQHALEMTKWFDTNYHYLVPEWHANTAFAANPAPLLAQVAEAQALGLKAKPVLVGPLTLLWLGKCKGAYFDRLSLLPALLRSYQALLTALNDAKVDWVQLDEPILALDLPAEWLAAFRITYQTLAATPLKLLLATYFGSVAEHADLLHSLPVAGLYLDLARAPQQLTTLLPGWPQGRVLSAGLVDGRNIWRNDLSATLDHAESLRQLLGEQLWLAPSCNLLHTPVDLAQEVQLDVDLKSWLAFSVQKLNELKLLKRGLVQGRDSLGNELAASDFARQQRRQHPRIHRADVS